MTSMISRILKRLADSCTADSAPIRKPSIYAQQSLQDYLMNQQRFANKPISTDSRSFQRMTPPPMLY